MSGRARTHAATVALASAVFALTAASVVDRPGRWSRPLRAGVVGRADCRALEALRERAGRPVRVVRLRNDDEAVAALAAGRLDAIACVDSALAERARAATGASAWRADGPAGSRAAWIVRRVPTRGRRRR